MCMKEEDIEFSKEEREKLDAFKKEMQELHTIEQKIKLLEEYSLVTQEEADEFRARKEEYNKIISKLSINNRAILTGKYIGKFPYWKLGNRLYMSERTLYRKIKEAEQELLQYLE